MSDYRKFRKKEYMVTYIHDVKVTSLGSVHPKDGSNTRMPYAHQKKFMENLD